MKRVIQVLLVGSLLFAGSGGVSAANKKRKDKKKRATKKHRRSDRKRPNESRRRDPKIVVFGDSTSDAGRRFAARASFDFEDIGPFPWKRLFEAGQSKKIKAYLPSKGTATNGPVWPQYLSVPQDLNFATSSATASDAFRSREICTGYTGEGEKHRSTATLGEQIKLYMRDFVNKKKDSTLGYTHVIILGSNDLFHAFDAVQRYSIASELSITSYEDPVVCTDIFGTDCCKSGDILRARLCTFDRGCGHFHITGREKLLRRGVTGRILVGNIASFKGSPGLTPELAAALENIALGINAKLAPIFAKPQVQKLDLYSLFAAISEREEVFTDMGFTAGTGASLNSPCLDFHFAIDDTAEIMHTQDRRGDSCGKQCALCADLVSPCQNCLDGNPSATVCEDDPDTRIFWDFRHPTTEFHRIFADAVKQCAKKKPNYQVAWVDILCPEEA